MITLDETTKAKLGNLIDSDGKVMITEDMPDDLKSCLKYINDNNINLFSTNPDAYVDDDEPEGPLVPVMGDDTDYDDDDDDDYDDSDDLEDVTDETVDQNTVNDLNDIF